MYIAAQDDISGLLQDIESTVTSSRLDGSSHMPVILQPAVTGLDPVAWARQFRDAIETLRVRHGSVLFRGFALPTPQAFEAFAEAMSPGLYGRYGDLPKKETGSNIYRSTPYPERDMILFHNESSHLSTWPCKQWFYCELPSRAGGCTPLVDVREMVRRLPHALAQRLRDHGLIYIRTFNEDFDVPWQDFFRTDDRDEVAARCVADGIDFLWLDQTTLQTRTRCDAIVLHPITRDEVFFNQVQLHHPSSLDPLVRQDLIELVGEERLPRNVVFGDGSAIPDDDMAVIGQLYEACAVRFIWQQGDVVLLDNLATAHARDPYEGPRKIVVAMGQMMARAELPTVDETPA